MKVLVVERREIIGGAAVTEEITPGYRTSTASYYQGLLQPKVILDLELQKYGFVGLFIFITSLGFLLFFKFLFPMEDFII